MTASTPSSNLGRHVFGVAALAIGLATLAWHDYNDWPQLRYVVYAVSAVQILGGAAIQFRPAAKTGAAVLLAAFLFFALLCVPQIVAAPRIYNSWGNFFEQCSLVTGAAIAYARCSTAWSPETFSRVGRILFGISTASFTLEQAFYLHATADLVPKWLPPSRCFFPIPTVIPTGAKPPKPSPLPEPRGFSLISSASNG